MKPIRLFAIAVLMFGLAACQKPTQTRPDEAGPATPGTGETTGTTGLGAESTPAAATPLSPQQQALADLQQKNVVYFDYDSSEIRSGDVAIVAAHAAYLVKYPAARVRLEGHTDERGSREYNIGLGERRAQTVRRALLAQGVAEAQLATVSYGEERPAAEGSDEAAYARNRRVEFVHAQ